jgi:DNA-binding HxlR family transcriptional regulator
LLSELADGGRRYQDLHDALDGLSHKVLTETLRRAQRDGLITRHLDDGRVETATLYELTDLGRSLELELVKKVLTRIGRAAGGGSRRVPKAPGGASTLSTPEY